MPFTKANSTLSDGCPLMQCHKHCAACCIAPHISSPLPNMPNGKPAGVPCVNLDEQLRCTVYDLRPRVCRAFSADPECCGSDHQQALKLIDLLEQQTSRDPESNSTQACAPVKSPQDADGNSIPTGKR